MRRRLTPELERAWTTEAEEWKRAGGTRRLWTHDASLWTGTGEDRWLGWLEAPAAARAQAELWREIGADGAGFAHAVVLGMGGSSLAPEVQRAACGRIPGHPELHVLDSIHPDQIAACTARLDLASTLVVVASKSGSTLEPNLLLAHLLEAVAGAVGAAEAPQRFVAVTDPGSKLEALARERGFRRVVLGDPTIGGRFSALSPFGLLPAALQGLDLAAWLEAAERMARACREDAPERNPGVALGLLLGASARCGRDKLTLVQHPALGALGAWLEQLVAESTGKRRRAVLPIDGEPLAARELYGPDRLFVALRFRGELAPGDGEKLAALVAAGQPAVDIDVAGPLELGAEFFRWEVATAVTGALLAVNPFEQPDVEAAKVEARRLAEEIERSGALPEEEPLARGDGWSLFAPDGQAGILRSAAGPRPAGVDLLRAHLARLGRGDYFALLAFCEMSPVNLAAASRLRVAVRDAKRVATSVGFGPRYLHSTGQAHKGGPDTGVFLVVTDEPRRDLPVPGQRATFGQAIAAQARGDYAVLAARGRRVIRVHLEGPAPDLLGVLTTAVERALG